jgi:serine/threonine protein kinase
MPRRVVAVKVLCDDAINPDVLRTFNSEADILARLSAHASIVTIFQASISADGRPYFVMDYCPDTMGARVKTAPLAVTDVLDVGVRVAAALETAHRSGVLHRDIKPSNILITTLGTPVLADFGIAAGSTLLDENPDVVAMSIPWSAPEVISQQISGSIPSEVWSLGATLYTLLAGRAPFELPSGEKIPRAQHMQRILKSGYVPTGRTDMGERLEAALKKSISKDIGDRFASMFEFAEELRWCQYELGMPPTPLEIAAPEWAAAAAPVDFASDVQRGPVISTVRQDSRRAQRAQTLASAQRVSERNASAPEASSSKTRASLIGGAVGAIAVAVIAVAILAMTGTI